MQRRQQSGFTLVELMITLAVAVILATLAIPSFVSFVEKSRLRGATDDLVALLNSSRAAAVKLQRDVNVSLGGSASGSWCAGASSAGNPASAGKNIPDAAACVCTTANACQVDGASSTVSSAGYSGVTLSSVQLSSTTGDGSVTFNSKTEYMPLPVGLFAYFGKQEVIWNELMAASFVGIAPAMIVIFFLQRYLVGGLTAGAVKQ